jgi:uncharacterized protein DUF6868
MSIELIRDVLLACTVINYGVLLCWFLFFTVGRDWLWFRCTAEQFDAIHYAGMALYKIGIFLFNLAPYIALRMVG